MAEQFENALEYIWEKVPKTKEGLIHYLPGDIPYLYLNGFVDTDKYTYEQWKNAFADAKQKDGTYLVDRDKFMELGRFRYSGPTFKPFDPQRIREGEWTDEELAKLYDLSIRHNTSVMEDVYWNSIKALKKQGFEKNGNLIVNKQVKTQLTYLIERFPSPRRKLEIEVNRIREEREEDYRKVAKDRDSSKFILGQMASESKMEKFKNLESKTGSKPPPSQKTHDTGSIDIKKLRKPSRKITG